MSSIHYYINDIETTGLKRNYHEITEISFIRCEPLVQFTRMIKIRHPENASKQAMQITRKNAFDLAKRGEYIEDVIPQANKFIESDGLTPEHRCLVGHNLIKFDRVWLANEWAKHGHQFPFSLFLDTVALTKQFVKQAGIFAPNGFNLGASLELLNVNPSPNAHSAGGDSQSNYSLFKKLQSQPDLDYLSLIKRIPNGLD